MINRLSHSRLDNISFIALVTILYFVPRSSCSLVTEYDIVSRAIKLISPRLSYDNLYILTKFMREFMTKHSDGSTHTTSYAARECYTNSYTICNIMDSITNYNIPCHRRNCFFNFSFFLDFWAFAWIAFVFIYDRSLNIKKIRKVRVKMT